MASSPSEQRNADASFATFVSSAVFNGSVAIGLYFTFCIIRRWDKKVYEPRTYLVDESQRSPELPRSLLGWLSPVIRANKKDIIAKAGLDAYMFIRFFNMCAKLFSILSAVCLGVLVPVNLIGKNGGLKGLEQFTIGNVSKQHNKLWVYVGVAYFVVAITLLFLFREYKTFVKLRHEFYTRRERIHSAAATTILVTGIPIELYSGETLRTLFNIFPGGVKRIWLNKDPKKLPDLTLRRENLVRELESAAIKLITGYDHSEVEPDAAREDGNDVPARLRPRHRKMYIGPSVDSLDYFHDELKTLNEKIATRQVEADYPPLNSAFIQFNEQIGAQLASTVTIPSLIEIQPKDVVWENLGFTHTQRMIRTTVVTAAATALIILWVFPVTFVASISNLKKIGEQLSFIGDVVNELPASVVGFIQGVLPAIALQVLMGVVLPFVLRSISRFEGFVTYSSAAMSVQKKYYFFLVVNVLLVTTFANGIFGTLKKLRDDPTSAVNILAENLPTASTFFVTYVLLSLSGAALQLCQLGPFVVHWVFRKWLARTPRQIWDLEHRIECMKWDIAFPTHTLMACIGLVYSAIQPLILPIVTLHFLLYKITYTYNLLYVFEQQNQAGGLTFVQAVYQMFTGLFLFELTMVGLFFLSTAFVPAVLMMILVGLTLAVLFAMLSIFKRNPSVEFLPVDLVGLLDIRHRKLLIAADGHQTYVHEKPNEAGSSEEDQPLNLPPEPEDVDADAFTHPAFIAQQPVVWLPEDKAGIARMEVEECYHNNIAASTEGARLDDETGGVMIDDMGPPEVRRQQSQRNWLGMGGR